MSEIDTRYIGKHDVIKVELTIKKKRHKKVWFKKKTVNMKYSELKKYTKKKKVVGYKITKIIRALKYTR